jgi:hypothetical protein
MSDVEEMLREAMRDHTDGLTVAPTTVPAALRTVRRSQRTRLVMTTGAAVVVAGGAAATIIVTHNPSGSAPRQRVVPAASGTVSSSPDAAPPSTRLRIVRHGAPAGAVPSEALQHVSLPDPAPGFPMRDTYPKGEIAYSSFGNDRRADYWSALFRVEQTAAKGGVPTGPEASVTVIDGPVPATPDSHNQIDGLPVIGHRTVSGRPAYLIHDGAATILNIDTGRFTVKITGDFGATVDELVALGAALHGLQ